MAENSSPDLEWAVAHAIMHCIQPTHRSGCTTTFFIKASLYFGVKVSATGIKLKKLFIIKARVQHVSLDIRMGVSL
jgi:hypothetical protein